MSLSPMQARFVEEFMLDVNATHAAIRAGYAKKNAKQQGYALLQKPAVREAIAKAIKGRSERAGISADRVLEEVTLLAFSDMGTYLQLDGEGTTARLDWSKLPEGATKIIQEITQEEHTGGKGHEKGQIKRTKFKLYDKQKALDMLMRHLGAYFDDKTKRDVGDGLLELMKRIDGKTRGLPS